MMIITRGAAVATIQYCLILSTHHIQVAHTFSFVRKVSIVRTESHVVVSLNRARQGGVCFVPRAAATARLGTTAWGRSSVDSNAHIEDGAEYVAEQLVTRVKRNAGNPGNDENEDGAGVGVFYNRVGAINRDLSVLMANVLAEERMSESNLKDTINSSVKKRARTASIGDGGSGDDRGGDAQEQQIHATDSSRDAGEEMGLRELSAAATSNESGLLVLDAFAASGVRALRYLTEVPGVRRVVANDHDTAAIELIKKGAELCGVGDQLEVQHSDALDTMYEARAGGIGTYDIVDIDPYGSAAGYLDAAVEAVTDGGLLCITSTDMPILSGAQPAVAFSRYGSVPTRAGHHHEMSLRILLHATSAAAGRHRRSIKPVLSVAINHYVRVFVRVFRSPKAALVAARKSTSYILQSENCPSFFLLPALSPQSVPRTRPPPSQSAQGGTATPLDITLPTRPDAAAGTGPSGSSAQQSAVCSSDNGEEGRYDDTASKPTSSASHRWLQPSPGGACPETGGALRLGGPFWSGPLHDEAWVARAIAMASEVVDGTTEGGSEVGGGEGTDASSVVGKDDDAVAVSIESGGLVGMRRGSFAPVRPRLAARVRAESLLRAVSRELCDVPLFYNLRDMFATMGLARSPRREQVMAALEGAGYRTSGMHKEPLALKTDAPDAAVWDVLRCWVRDNPQPPPVRAAGLAIIARGPQLITDVDFSKARVVSLDEKRAGEATRGRRGDFLHAHNPEEGWGPIAKGTFVEVHGTKGGPA